MMDKWSRDLPPNDLSRKVTETIYGLETIHVAKSANARQRELRDWLQKVDLHEEGWYYIDVSEDYWISCRDFNPAVKLDQAWDLVENETIWSDEDHYNRIYWSINQTGRGYRVFARKKSDKGVAEWVTSHEHKRVEVAICKTALKAIEKHRG